MDKAEYKELLHAYESEVAESFFLYRYNTDGVFIYASPSVTKVTGYSVDEFCTDFKTHMTPSPVNQQVFINSSQSISGIKPPPFEVEIYHKNGEVRYLQVQEFPVFDSQDEDVIAVEGLAIDITQLKNLITENEQQKNLLQSVIDATTDMIVYKDKVGQFLGCNTAFAEYMGFGAGSVTCQDFKAQLPVDLQKRLDYQDAEVLNSLKAHKFEDWITYPDGKEALVETVKAPYFDQAGNLLGLVCVSRDITERKFHEKEIYTLAHYDPLTGLANRNLFRELLKKAILLAARDSTFLAVLFIDLDDFKQVNDAFGHHVGDRLLCEVAKRLKNSRRASDTVAHLGGDEFAILVGYIKTPEDAALIAQSVLDVLRPVFEVEDHLIYAPASIGISVFPGDGDTAEILLRNADAAMYRAKNSVKNSYDFYTAELTQIAVDQVKLNADLRHALENSEFTVFYQPKFDSHSLEMIGAEALVRWYHPEKGLLLPSKFISEVEKSDFILHVGLSVFRQAAKLAVSLREKGLEPGVISVNLSSKQIYQDDLLKSLSAVLQETGAKAEWLELEVIERVAMHSLEKTVKLLGKLREMGFSISIDDFGTGYSSLTYLKRLPVDSIKVDGSFIKNIASNNNDYEMVKAIVAIANSFGYDIIAEGVEEAAQLEKIQQLGCDAFQGYFRSEPLTESDFETFIRNQ